MPTVSSGVPKLHCGWDPVSHDVRKQVHPGSIQLTRTTLDHLGLQLFPKLFSVLFRVHIPTPRFTRTYIGFQSSPNRSPDLRLFFSGLNDKQAHPDTSPKQQASPHAAKPTDLKEVFLQSFGMGVGTEEYQRQRKINDRSSRQGLKRHLELELTVDESSADPKPDPSKPIKKITCSYRRKRTVEQYPDIPSDKP
ncbi:hypothetical protein PCASD_23310 [Puccinia coronata f. sp. avenae]|uniref:Uncharacterized protein n=1 Tax=Puccinia coronata f. sp. avenae TaxID=200324 RepID=A0A2N5TSL6_9BASI|nr:hypothetical protein PCASD_23310 [Puccinia coronata f. sp. avenae]